MQFLDSAFCHDISVLQNQTSLSWISAPFAHFPSPLFYSSSPPLQCLSPPPLFSPSPQYVLWNTNAMGEKACRLVSVACMQVSGLRSSHPRTSAPAGDPLRLLCWQMNRSGFLLWSNLPLLVSGPVPLTFLKSQPQVPPGIWPQTALLWRAAPELSFLMVERIHLA